MSMILTVAGFVTKDPEERVTAKGVKMTVFTVCPFGKTGDGIYINCMVVGEHLNGILQYVKKGTHASVTGQFTRPEVFVGRDGEPKVSMKMFAGNIALLPRGEKSSQPIKTEAKILESQLTVGADAIDTAEDIEERLPF